MGEAMTGIGKEIVIPREDAVFWMDERGRWCNQYGPFEHPKIIAYFNQAIRRDAQGYFVEQAVGAVREKVYFRYADTPLYVVDIVEGEPPGLALNTGERTALNPVALFVARDNLYLRRGEERIRFSERALLKLADSIDYRDCRYFFRLEEGWQPIAEETETAPHSSGS